uniref:Uncharacterized protein n=1 Tax=Oncorhynchus mykiss TaxID=8022 RepID=A0A8K9WRX2_ONCMY
VPCVYKRKTSRSLTPLEVLDRAAKEVKEGKKSIRAAAMEYFVLLSDTEEVKKRRNKQTCTCATRYDRLAETHKVLSDDMESELAKNLKNFTDQFHGLSNLKCRNLAYELAHRNKIPVPDNGHTFKIYNIPQYINSHYLKNQIKSNQISSYLYNRGVPQLTDSYSYEFYDQVCCYMHCACNTA